VKDLKQLVVLFKKRERQYWSRLPDNPWDQLWGSVFAVFNSWNNDRAMYYRQLNNIPHEWGTAVMYKRWSLAIWAIVAPTGVAFTRDAATGGESFQTANI
jgi:pyruvate,orthophosphate dikinase